MNDSKKALEQKQMFDEAINGAMDINDVNITECKTHLKCFNCGGEIMSWFCDNNAGMVLFRCHSCETGNRISIERYEKFIKDVPGLVSKS